MKNRQLFDKFGVHALIFLVLTVTMGILRCAGVGGGGLTADGAGEDSGGGEGGGASAGDSALFEGGPVSIPVTIAKLDAPDPSNITVDVSGTSNSESVARASSSISLTGNAGALPNPSATPQVYIYNSATAETKITDVKSDGSFAKTTVDGEGPLLVAGYDGTNIGTPIFLKVSEGKYVWFLTNGGQILASVLTEEGGTTYVAARTSLATSLSSPDLAERNRQGRQSGSSDIYSLDIAGVSELKGSLSCVIDEIFVRDGEIVARCGNEFYLYTESSGSFEKKCEIPSPETIMFVDVERDENDVLYTAAATGTGAYVCSTSDGEVTQIDTIDPGCETYSLLMLFIYDGSGQYNGDLIAALDSRNSCLTPVQSQHQMLNMSGNVVSITYTNSYGAEETFQDSVSNESTGSSLTLSKISFTEGDTKSYYQYYEPNTLSSSCTAGSDTLDVIVIQTAGMGGGSPYILDGSLTLQEGSGQSYTSFGHTICDATRTRTVHHVELHSSAKIACFCADDENGNGQLYAYCPSEVEFMQDPDGSEIRQLTEGVEHCNEVKNWRCEDSIVIVGTHSDFTEVQISVPESDPKLEGCF